MFHSKEGTLLRHLFPLSKEDNHAIEVSCSFRAWVLPEIQAQQSIVYKKEHSILSLSPQNIPEIKYAKYCVTLSTRNNIVY